MPRLIDSLSWNSCPASQAKLTAQIDTPTNTAMAMFVCLDKMVTTSGEAIGLAKEGHGCQTNLRVVSVVVEITVLLNCKPIASPSVKAVWFGI